MKNFLLGLILVALNVVPAEARSREGQFQNLDRMIEDLNLRQYFEKNLRLNRTVKVAIFDNGFLGAKNEIGRLLPRNTQIHDGPVALEKDATEEAHGYYMARIFWSLVSNGGRDNRYAPAQFHLYRTFGYSNLEAAVNDAIKRRIDVVLYSQTWEYGGNFDGKGFINALITKAARNGILWINNAGNFGDTTFNAPVKTGADDWVELPGKNSSVEIRCAENPTGKCPLRAVLSWNDFSDKTEIGSDKDLDFLLTDDTLNIIQGSSLKQAKTTAEPGTSLYPREIVTAELKPGLYFLRVKNRSKNFKAKDFLRISVSGDFVKMAQFDRRESVLPPADNSLAITVGALDSEKSSLSVSRQKPELLANSLVSISSKENFKGTSNSAAMVAAGAAILLAIKPDLNKNSFLELVSRKGPMLDGQRGRGLPLNELEFQPTTREGCFSAVNPKGAPRFVAEMLRKGGTLVRTDAGNKIFFAFDPIRLFPEFYRRQTNDMIVNSENGPGIYARSGMWNMPENMIELVQIPYGRSICSASTSIPTWSRVFRLPNLR